MSYPPYSGYPPQQNAPMQYPPQQQGVTPYGGGYPGASNYPPASGGGYPPQQQPYGGQPPAPGFNTGGGGGYSAPQQQPSYPQQPGGGYPAQQQPGQYPGAGGGYPGGSAYPSQQPAGYPAPQPSAYPAHQPATGGYPSSGGYPSQQQPAGYPSQQPAGYPSQQPAGYPSQQPAGYPSQQSAGYPSQQPAGYPAPQQQQGGYPGVQPVSGYPSQQPHGGGYPAQQSGAAGYPTSQPSGYGAGYPNISGGAAPVGHGGGYPGGQQQVILTPVMSAMTPFEGTVRPAPNFNPNQDAEALKKAMKGIGCDDKAIVNVLCYRTNAQRQQIRLMFKTMYGKDLVKELISELRGNFEDLIIALLYTQGEYDARELDHAMKGMGTIESTLIEIMVTRTNAEVQAIKEAFRRLFGRDLEQALSNETSGHFKRLLVSLTVGGRDESTHTDPSYAAQQAKQLYEAGEKQWGTNESAFNAIMVASNPNQLQLVFENYRKITGHDVEQAVKSEFSGDIEDGLLTVVKCAKNRPAYFAERAYQAMRGMGTHDRALIRVIVSRCEKDMVQIKQEYQRMYKTPLENAISGDCSGKYKEGLLALVKGR